MFCSRTPWQMVETKHVTFRFQARKIVSPKIMFQIPKAEIISHDHFCLRCGRREKPNFSECRHSVVNHYWVTITDRSVFACTHFIMNASHKSSLNDSSLNDSHSSDCLLSGGRSWIKPLTRNQGRVTSRGQQAQAPNHHPAPAHHPLQS